jgi:hypothetical protein
MSFSFFRRFLPLVALAFAVSAFGQGYQPLFLKAQTFHRAHEFQKSADTFKQAFAEFPDSRTGPAYYAAACSAMAAGDTVQTLSWLRTAVDLGWTERPATESNPLFQPLHDNPAWTRLLEDMVKKAAAREAAYDRPLQAELLAILKSDQDDRHQIGEVEKKFGRDSKEVRALWAKIERQDAANLAKVAAMLDRTGWVGPDRVGAEASQAIFLVIQHADLKAQQKYLPLMRKAVKAKQAEGSELAMLEDRVALGEGRRQLYGTQIGRKSENGDYYVSPLEDPDHVDQRRAEVNLTPLADYVKHWGLVWDVEAYKKQLPSLERNEKR